MRFTNGNKKIGKDTLIFNMGPAKSCPSKALGLCQLPKCSLCYAWRAEKRFPDVLAFRERQKAMWLRETPDQMAADLTSQLRRPRVGDRLKYVRFNESGDFWSQRCVQKLSDVARKVSGLQFYGYTARSDLHFGDVPQNVTINCSGWFAGPKSNTFQYTTKASGQHYVCPGDCRTCDVCKKGRSLTIEVVKH